MWRLEAGGFALNAAIAGTYALVGDPPGDGPPVFRSRTFAGWWAQVGRTVPVDGVAKKPLGPRAVKVSLARLGWLGNSIYASKWLRFCIFLARAFGPKPRWRWRQLGK